VCWCRLAKSVAQFTQVNKIFFSRVVDTIVHHAVDEKHGSTLPELSVPRALYLDGVFTVTQWLYSCNTGGRLALAACLAASSPSSPVDY